MQIEEYEFFFSEFLNFVLDAHTIKSSWKFNKYI